MRVTRRDPQVVLASITLRWVQRNKGRVGVRITRANAPLLALINQRQLKQVKRDQRWVRRVRRGALTSRHQFGRG